MACGHLPGWGANSAGPPESLARGLFGGGTVAEEKTVRVAFLIDGFNLYHSIRT